jgi:hypothetical protein
MVDFVLRQFSVALRSLQPLRLFGEISMDLAKSQEDCQAERILGPVPQMWGILV